MKRTLEVMRAASWLGWQIEANWADPFLFIVYSIAKPLSTTLILFFMVRVVARGAATAESFLFLFIGNTFFLYVTEVLVGISWAVFRDREDYETLKYIVTSPIGMFTYLTGRASVKLVLATVSLALTLAVAWSCDFTLTPALCGHAIILVKFMATAWIGERDTAKGRMLEKMSTIANSFESSTGKGSIKESLVATITLICCK